MWRESDVPILPSHRGKADRSGQYLSRLWPGTPSCIPAICNETHGVFIVEVALLRPKIVSGFCTLYTVVHVIHEPQSSLLPTGFGSIWTRCTPSSFWVRGEIGPRSQRKYDRERNVMELFVGSANTLFLYSSLHAKMNC